MTRVTSAEFQKHFGDYKRQALSQPVTISIHGKDTLVLLSHETYEQLLAGNPKAIKTPMPTEPRQEDELDQLARIANGKSSDIRFQDDLMDSKA
ncbi:type II toxin-antitoxin system Phd/YefM family antitoxin [Defluviimonas salinarum]|uniref:Antitoxin n=1 Tax=Defluviimonas salinarum TaxID=2992147 RepID=A0ABT3J7E4_9RHOB|nr:type II toxin-antitoxin system Phd/YefM family antitoxin [Defluviimonas salinarum]MCW3783584.1 type II toxin-antitoxin system Phd/YefM family antitoxin [Defluviimonas salinarum]